MGSLNFGRSASRWLNIRKSWVYLAKFFNLRNHLSVWRNGNARIAKRLELLSNSKQSFCGNAFRLRPVILRSYLVSNFERLIPFQLQPPRLCALAFPFKSSWVKIVSTLNKVCSRRGWQRPLFFQTWLELEVDEGSFENHLEELASCGGWLRANWDGKEKFAFAAAAATFRSTESKFCIL